MRYALCIRHQASGIRHYTPPVPKSSSRPSWLLPVILAPACILLAWATPRLPGDPTVARAVQSLGVGPDPAFAITSLVTRPAVYGLMLAGVVLATWRGRLRGLVASVALLGLWWYVGEPLKELVHRPRPTSAFVEVVRPASGFSFPSTFATTWFATWLPMTVYAWRTRQRSAGLVVVILGSIAMLLGGWARVRVGAHWPSDLLMTFGVVWATFVLIDRAVDRIDGA